MQLLCLYIPSVMIYVFQYVRYITSARPASHKHRRRHQRRSLVHSRGSCPFRPGLLLRAGSLLCVLLCQWSLASPLVFLDSAITLPRSGDQNVLTAVPPFGHYVHQSTLASSLLPTEIPSQPAPVLSAVVPNPEFACSSHAVKLQLPIHMLSATLMADYYVIFANPLYDTLAGYPSTLYMYDYVMLYATFVGAGYTPYFQLPTVDWSAIRRELHEVPTRPLNQKPPFISNTRTPAFIPNATLQSAEHLANFAGSLSYLCAFQSKASRFHEIMDFSPGSVPVCIDTGASSCIGNRRSDFLILRDVSGLSINGIGTGLSVQGVGSLKWVIVDDCGVELELIITNALFVPDCPMNLLSPQQVAQQTTHAGDGFHAQAGGGTLTVGGRTRFVPYSAESRLPILHTASTITSPAGPTTCMSAYVPDGWDIPLTVIEQKALTKELSTDGGMSSVLRSAPPNGSENASDVGPQPNISKVQQLLLRIHYRLGHIAFGIIQRLARAGLFPKSVANCVPPLCAFCQIGKARQQAIPTATNGRPIDAGHLNPGDCVSCDQLQSTCPGRIPVSRGTPSTSFYHAATLFVDHASRYVHVTPNRSTGADEALESKRAFERDALSHGVQVRSYRSDNGIFASNAFKASCAALNQAIDYCAVGAHHQNGIAERHIQTTVNRARTMLLHAMYRWPDVCGTELWPFAIAQAVNLANATPGPTGLCAAEIFTGRKSRCRLEDFHTFGCPVFVLEARLQQQGASLPKWEPRSRMAVYLGHSPDHASNIPLVLSTRTGLVSPQFHVVYDDQFTTTQCLRTNTLPANWDDLFKFKSVNSLSDSPELQSTHTLGEEWQDLSSVRPRHVPRTTRFNHDAVDELDLPERRTNPASEGAPGASEGARPVVLRPDPSPEGAIPVPEGVQFGPEGARAIPEGARGPSATTTSILRPVRTVSSTAPAGWNSGHKYSTRFRERVQVANVAAHTEAARMMADDSIPLDRAAAYLSEHAKVLGGSDGNLEHISPLAHLAAGDNDTLNFGQMLKAEDRTQFELGMQKEMDALVANDIFEIVPKRILDAGARVVSAIWSFKRKRLPDWTVSKYRARVCPHGGQQIQGINFWETYAPVVQWSTVRLALILSTLGDLKSRQVDYVQAYTQANIDCDLYMAVPAGFIVQDNKLVFVEGLRTKDHPNDHVLKLKKNMYGLRQAGHIWFEKLRAGLLNRGFVQSKVDKCLFLRSDCILVVYVDDCLFFSRSDTVLNDLITSLEQDFVLTHEGDVGAFLGIDVRRHEDGALELIQPGLIQKIVVECGLEENSQIHDTPSKSEILQRADPDNLPRETTWNYRMLIGMLTYLSASSRPDISYAVHQCARFSVNPQRCHELAVKRIVRYLKGTNTQGFHLRPATERRLDCYVDADFTGNWTPATSHDPNSVKSRTGYVILFASCPVLWASKLQSEIALSTTEAEYIALSQAMRDLIPMRSLLQEISTITKMDIGNTRTYRSKVYEDNKGCVDVIKSPKVNPRTRHISIKYHHFREHVTNGNIEVEWIDTKNQLADIFTKPLSKQAFTYLRNKLLGW